MDKLKKGLRLIEQLHQAGYSAYLVGGAVRDFLLNKEIEDVDIATGANPDEIKQQFEQVDLSFAQYGTSRVFFSEEWFEVTTYRKEIVYSDHRHPKVVLAKTLEEDLKRRDFTINALAMAEEGVIIDRFGGLQDLKDKRIKTIGCAAQRFEEDGLRLLRAAYFASKLDFQWDKEIEKAILKKDFLLSIPKEYIKKMLEKILEQPSRIGLKYVVDCNMLRGFPFYAVVAEECFDYELKKEEMYASFYVRHGFLPCGECLSNREIKIAKKAAILVHARFDSVSLYRSTFDEIVFAAKLMRKSASEVEEIVKRYDRLPIRSSKDIRLDIQTVVPNKRSFVLHAVEEKILKNQLNNNEKEIAHYIKECLL